MNASSGTVTDITEVAWEDLVLEGPDDSPEVNLATVGGCGGCQPATIHSCTGCHLTDRGPVRG